MFHEKYSPPETVPLRNNSKKSDNPLPYAEQGFWPYTGKRLRSLNNDQQLPYPGFYKDRA